MRYVFALLAALCLLPLAADTLVERNPWDLYIGTRIAERGFATEAACIQAADDRNELRTYTCRTRTAITVLEDADGAVDCDVDNPPWLEGPLSPAVCPSSGEQTRTDSRTLTVLTQPSNGGAACPDLNQSRTVTVSCDYVPGPPPVASQWPGVPQPPIGLTEVSDGNYRTSCGTYNGTAEAPVFVKVTTTNDCTIAGSYIIVEASDLRRTSLSGHHIAIRDSRVHGSNNGAMLMASSGSTDIVILRNEVDHNGVIPSNADRHGISLGGDTDRVWILDNHIHENSGDAIQFCHNCINQGNGPGAVYISNNKMHHDEENALDFKEFKGPLVVTNNEMWGYQPSASGSSNGDAFRINDEGQQGELWAAYNVCHDNRLDINPDNSRAVTYLLDNQCRVSSTRSRGKLTQASGDAALPYYQLYEQKYGVSLAR